MEWLGAVWDSKDLCLKLPGDKVVKIQKIASSLLAKKSTMREEWESLLDHLAFAAQVAKELNLHKKLLGPVLPQFPSGQNRSLNLSDPTLLALDWWTKSENFNKWFPFNSPPA